VTLGATLVASLLAALSRPSTWPLALIGFLLRGGVLPVLAPIVVLPTAVGLANLFAPFLEDVAFGRRPDEVASLVAWLLTAMFGWLIGGGLVAAAAEAELIRRVAADDDLVASGWVVPGRGARRALPARILAVRLVASAPLVLALAWGSIRVVTVAYRELTVPSDTGVALVVRVVAGAPEAVIAILVAWLLGEIVGAMAARRVVLLGERTLTALWRAAGDLARRPVRRLVLAALPLAQIVVVLVAIGAAGSATWGALQAALAFDDGSPARWALLAAFVGLFGAGLVLIAVTSAWRSAVWTVDTIGTFGGATASRLGDWKAAAPSATLGALRPGGVDPTEVMDDHAVDRLR